MEELSLNFQGHQKSWKTLLDDKNLHMYKFHFVYDGTNPNDATWSSTPHLLNMGVDMATDNTYCFPAGTATLTGGTYYTITTA